MPIPAFDLNSVLPPHLGDPRQRADLSPYPCTSKELCDRFKNSPERVEILEGFLKLRADLHQHGLVDGFQWIDGSFLEDVESTEGRAPRDIDVVTFYWSADPNFAANLVAAFPAIIDHARIKSDYHVDHYMVDIAFDPEATVEMARYWCGLFSHTRNGVWKGMVRIELNTPVDDTGAKALLGGRP